MTPYILSSLAQGLITLVAVITLILYSRSSPLKYAGIAFATIAGFQAITTGLAGGITGTQIWATSAGRFSIVSLFWVASSALLMSYAFPTPTQNFEYKLRLSWLPLLAINLIVFVVWFVTPLPDTAGRELFLLSTGLFNMSLFVPISVFIQRARRASKIDAQQSLATALYAAAIAVGLYQIANIGLWVRNVTQWSNDLTDLILSLGIIFFYVSAPYVYGLYAGEEMRYMGLITLVFAALILIGLVVSTFLLGSRLVQSHAELASTITLPQYLDQHLRPFLWVMIGSAIFTTIGTPLMLRKVMMRPLLALFEGVRLVEAGQFNQRLAVYHDDEIGRLTRGFNSMVESLKHSQALLKRSNQLLEKRVADRTQELELAKESAEVANLAKTTFLANMSHELRTPLNAILGYTQILKREEVQPSAVSIIEQSGEHLLLLIDDVLDMAKVETGNLTLNSAELIFPRFLNQVGAMARLPVEGKGLAFCEEIDPQLPRTVITDGKRLRQVLINLLSNATKFTAQGSVTLRVKQLSASAEKALIRFEVTDTGIGIPINKQTVIFEPFHQLFDHDQAASQGTGLGLAISHDLVALMNGTLQVESTVGAGSRFWFDIPLQTAERRVFKTKPDKRIIGVRDAPIIMIVDDKIVNRMLLIDLLSPIGCQVVEVENGEAVLAQLETAKPDVLITDLVMPRIDGLELIRRLKSSVKFADLPIIAVSASMLEHRQQPNLDIGADAFLPKPIDTDLLLQTLADVGGLEWIYDTVASVQPSFAETSSAETLISPKLPSKNMLQTLLKHAQMGDVQEVERLGDQLVANAAEFQPFNTQLQKYTKTYRIDALCSWLGERVADGTEGQTSAS